MSDYRESSNFAKDVRRGVVDIRGVGGKKRQGKRSVIVEIRYPRLKSLPWAQNWHKFGAYETEEIANQVIANKTRGTTSSAEYRIKP